MPATATLEENVADRMRKYATDHGLGPEDTVVCSCGTPFYPAKGEGFIYECGPWCSKECFDLFTED
jgi:hypothetical protein